MKQGSEEELKKQREKILTVEREMREKWMVLIS